MSMVFRFSLITVREFLHKCQPKVGRWSKKVQIVVNVVKECHQSSSSRKCCMAAAAAASRH